MPLESLANKYRPKKLEDVIGQPIVVKAFKNAFKYKTLHHAYIFGGNLGGGKTSTARIVAAMENCKNIQDLNPCGKCKICKDIFEGKSFDVKEIDAASNRGIENIRNIHTTLYQSPIECRTRYVIFDEAHSLTGYAAEAALKMIEEPPKNTRFILATTAPHKIKDTIHSRCILWKFKKVNWIEISNHLKNICEKENVSCEESVLKAIAQHSKGSVRNSLCNLQSILQLAGDKKTTITLSDVKDSLSVVTDEEYFNLINAIIEDRGDKCFLIIQKILEDGKEADIVLDGLYNHLNNLVLVKKCKEEDLSEFSLSDIEIKKYKMQLSNIKSPSFVLKLMSLLPKVSFGLTVNLNPQSLLNNFAYEACLRLRPKKEEK